MSVATRPLVWNCGASAAYYAHDGNKNVSEVISADGILAAHYEYAPFGAVIAQRGASAAANLWRFSSEFADDDTATIYYNYRHYEPVMGRWLQRDLIGEIGGWNIYAFCRNSAKSDFLGLGGIDDDLGGMIGGMWPASPSGWGAEAELQRLERERQETESAMPDLSAIIGVSGPRNFPVGGGWGISLTANISWEFGSCCDKTENKRKEYRKLIGSISASPYVGVAPIIEIPSPNPPEVRIDLDECPPSGESYDGFLSFKFAAVGANFECSFLFSDKKWHCGAGFSLDKITSIKLSIEGGVSYEKVTY